MEWKLFDDIPEYITTPFFERYRWTPPESQRGHAERIDMVANLVKEIHVEEPIQRLIDLGCGDGSFLSEVAEAIGHANVRGIDLGRANVNMARSKGLNVSQGSFFELALPRDEFVVMTEVLEHLIDPHDFLRNLDVSRAVFSSPWDEDDQNYYSEHAWAWDEAGYANLMSSQGWQVHHQVRCDAGFQAIYVKR